MGGYHLPGLLSPGKEGISKEEEKGAEGEKNEGRGQLELEPKEGEARPTFVDEEGAEMAGIEGGTEMEGSSNVTWEGQKLMSKETGGEGIRG